MATKPAKPMCCVTIGFEHLLMPADTGMKVIALLQSAVRCEQRYDAERTYEVQPEPLELECRIVPASKIMMPSGASAQPKLLGSS
jgi:hypothetical protein